MVYNWFPNLDGDEIKCKEMGKVLLSSQCTLSYKKDVNYGVYGCYYGLHSLFFYHFYAATKHALPEVQRKRCCINMHGEVNRPDLLIPFCL